jgi:DNA-binding transcriptional LysR family regulator
MNINLARLHPTSIRLVILCAENGSLSAASRLARFTVSAASQRLSGLEQSLGAKLFIRDARGLQLTVAGEHFVRHGKAVLEQLELLENRNWPCMGTSDA